MTIKIKADVVLVPQYTVAGNPTSECSGCVFDGLADMRPCVEANDIERCDAPKYEETMVYTIKNANVKERVL